ncbi:MAG: hypothetical protein Q9177_002711 [Variospora cf. flavescens]
MSWSVADASLALFHHTSFDYPVKTESETLEHIGSYAGHLPFAADSHVRPDGYGLLDHQLLQSISVPMPVSTPKYSRFPGGFEIPPYTLHTDTKPVDISCQDSRAVSFCMPTPT